MGQLFSYLHMANRSLQFSDVNQNPRNFKLFAHQLDLLAQTCTPASFSHVMTTSNLARFSSKLPFVAVNEL